METSLRYVSTIGYSQIAVVFLNHVLPQATMPEADWGPYLQRFRGERYANMKEPTETLALQERRGDTNFGYEPEGETTNVSQTNSQTDTGLQGHVAVPT